LGWFANLSSLSLFIYLSQITLAKRLLQCAFQIAALLPTPQIHRYKGGDWGGKEVYNLELSKMIMFSNFPPDFMAWSNPENLVLVFCVAGSCSRSAANTL
jgi:hypothetical protein